MTKYRLDKSSFKAQTFREADNTLSYWSKKSIEERLTAAWFLIRQAYGFIDKPVPRIDKTFFSFRKHNEKYI